MSRATTSAAQAVAPALAPATPSRLLRHSAVFAIVSTGVYLLSMVKTIVVSQLFGTSAAMDAFGIAILVPNTLATLAGGAAAAALVPVLGEFPTAERRSAVFRGALSLVFVVYGALTLLIAVFAEPILKLIAGKFDHYRFELAVSMLRWSAPLVLLSAVAAFLSAEQLQRRAFGFTAAAPGISTAISILMIFFFQEWGVSVLVWGLLVGTAVQVGVVGVASLTTSMAPAAGWNDPDVKGVVRAHLPLIAVSAFSVANAAIDQSMATWLPVGSVSALNYSLGLNTLITQVVVMAVGWVALPEFSSLVAAGDVKQLKAKMSSCVSGAVILAAPVTVFIAGCAPLILRVLLERGSFDAESTLLVSGTWTAYTIGLVPLAIGMMAARVVNARKEHWVLVRIGAVTSLLNVVLNAVLMGPFGLSGIALSTSLVFVVSTTLLYVHLNRRMGSLFDRATKALLVRAIVTGLVAYVPFAASQLSSRTSPIDTTFAALVACMVFAVGYSRGSVRRYLGMLTLRGRLKQDIGPGVVQS